MGRAWDPDAPGVVTLPSGRRVRGRGLRHPLPAGPLPELGTYLLGRAPEPVAWRSRWVRWPDFRLPADPTDLRAALDGVAPTEAVAWVRQRYDARAVETPFQARFVRRFGG